MMTPASLAEKPAARTPQNLMDAILRERDRLTALRGMLQQTGDYDRPPFAFYKANLDGLIDRAADAIGGRTHVVDMLVLLNELKELKG